MRAYELIELSALVAVNGQSFVQGQGRMSEAGISQYWSVCRSRFDRWARTLKTDWERLQSGKQKAPAVWRHVRPVLEEILTGEMLTRIWTAVACQHDRQHGASYVSPVVGDQVFSELRGEGTATGNRIVGTFLGSTGRYAGAEGTYEFSWRFVLEAEDGTVQGQSVGLRGRVRTGATPAAPGREGGGP